MITSKLVSLFCVSCVVASVTCMQKDEKFKEYSRKLYYGMHNSQAFEKKRVHECPIVRDTTQEDKQNLRTVGRDDALIHYVPSAQPAKKEEAMSYVPRAVYYVAGLARSWWGQDLHVIDWSDPYVVQKQTSLRDGFKNYLQWIKAWETGIEIYDACAREMIIKKAPVMRFWWADNNSCICIARIRDDKPEALIYDFKKRAVHRVFPCTGNLLDDQLFGTNDNVRFVTNVQDALHITHIRPERQTFRVFRKECEIVRSYFCDTHAWVLYKEKQTHQFPHAFKQTLVVYDIQKGYKEIKEIPIDGPFKHIVYWDGPKDRKYITFCVGEMLHVYDMTTAELVYKNKQRPDEWSMIGVLNQSATRYVVSNYEEGFVTTHDLRNQRSFELYRVHDYPITCFSGFQNQYVGVRVHNEKESGTFRFYDSNNGELMTAISCAGKLDMYGYGPLNCYIIVSDEECIIFDYRENKIRLQQYHDRVLDQWGMPDQNRYCVVAQKNNLIVLDFTQGSIKKIEYTDTLHKARFSQTGDYLLVAHGKKVDVVKSFTGETIQKFDLKDFTAHTSTISSDGKWCAVLLQDDTTIIQIYDVKMGNLITSLGYCNDVKEMQFDQQSTMFVVTTKTETYTYDITNNF